MVHLVVIGRLQDGMPLVASFDSNSKYAPYNTKARQLFRRMNFQTPSRGSIDTNENLYFHYINEKHISYICLCESQFDRNSAFSFLEEIALAFEQRHGQEVFTATRPFSFIEFDSFISEVRKKYMSNMGTSNLNRLNNDLQDVQKIMVQNIDDVLSRGVAVDLVQDKATKLNEMATTYRQNADKLNKNNKYAAIGIGITCFIFAIIFLRYFIF
ncbi:hypothetical protein SNEBB_006340 [Seison nebaliae]|nr:hypothetical protein SNEBB_006340 [Seison nebaliae]